MLPSIRWIGNDVCQREIMGSVTTSVYLGKNIGIDVGIDVDGAWPMTEESGDVYSLNGDVVCVQFKSRPIIS